MPSIGSLEHWQSVYARKGETEVSWFQDSPQPSLDLIEAYATQSSVIVDIGGGASHLADALLQRQFRDVTVLDLSSSALAVAKARLGGRAKDVHWIAANVVAWEPERVYDVWHDRAAFHFLVDQGDRAAYLARLARALRPGGYAVIATFAPDGPERCSGLPVMRYDADGLAQTLGPSFRLVSARRHEHVTPWGTPQSFQFGVFHHQPCSIP